MRRLSLSSNTRIRRHNNHLHILRTHINLTVFIFSTVIIHSLKFNFEIYVYIYISLLCWKKFCVDWDIILMRYKYDFKNRIKFKYVRIFNQGVSINSQNGPSDIRYSFSCLRQFCLSFLVTEKRNRIRLLFISTSWNQRYCRFRVQMHRICFTRRKELH